jgi:hypothetical protein
LAKKKARPVAESEKPEEGTYERLVYEAFDCNFADPKLAVFYVSNPPREEGEERHTVLNCRKIPGSTAKGVVLWQVLDLRDRSVLLSMADHGRKG